MKTNYTRIISGLAITVLGSILLLSNLNILNFDNLISNWWPLVLVGAGILIFINDSKNYLWALLLTIFGILLQLKELDLLTINPWSVIWPLAIISIGISIMLNRSSKNKITSKEERDDATAILAGIELKSSSKAYKGSKATAIMGGLKIDLRKATISDKAVVDVFSFWGGVEIIVPRNIIIKNQTNAILGSIENKTDQDSQENAHTLYITGDVIMAGIEIKN